MDTVIVLARVKPGQAEPLKAVLTQINDLVDNDHIDNNPYIRFDQDRYTHFARWIVFENPGHGQMLLYMSVHDGSLEDYIAEVVRTSPGLDVIWGHCEGYTGKAHFLAFVQANLQTPHAPFYAFRDETLASIRAKTGVRVWFEGLASLGDVTRLLAERRQEPFLDALEHAAGPPGPWRRLRATLATLLANCFSGLRAGLAWIAVTGSSWFGQLGENPNFSRVTDTWAPAAQQERANWQVTQLEAIENIFQQNQFTVLARIKPGYLWLLKLVLFLTTYVNRYLWPVGQITGLYTIYTFHWILINNGRYVIGFSNYDGSMENYVGDFLDKFGTGLDAYFKNCVGYPDGGIRQVPQFLSWVRQNQLYCQLYYSAYPHQNVLNILRDRQISDPLARRFSRDAVIQWLRQL